MRKAFLLLIATSFILMFSCSQPTNNETNEITTGITACGDFMFVERSSTLITYHGYGVENWIRVAIENDFKMRGLPCPTVVNYKDNYFTGWTVLPCPTEQSYAAVRIYWVE